MLNRQRREKPLFDKAVKAGERMVRQRFGVDEDVCTGDHACIRLSGCPSLSVKQTDDPLRDDPVAAIDNTCVGCGNCGEVAEAAVLCPSFYRADIIINPTGWDRVAGAHARRRHRLPAAPARAAGGCGWPEDAMDAVISLASPRHATADRHRGAGDGRPGRRRAGRLDRGADRGRRAGWRNRPRCPASPSAPAPRSIMSRPSSPTARAAVPCCR